MFVLCSASIAAQDTPPSLPMVEIDMRHGLPESRVRALLPLPDGRLAIATAGYIGFFDGTSFISETIDPGKGISLMATGKNRQLFHDNKGHIWLKTPASRQEKTGRLHAFDIKSGEDITDRLLTGDIREEIKDFFADESGKCWIIDRNGNLRSFADGKAETLLNLANISDSLPSYLSTDGERLYLCYDSGKVCVIDISSGLLEYMGNPDLPKQENRISNSGIKWNNGRMWMAYHRRNDHSNTWIASLDTATREWDVRHIDKELYDFAFAGNDSIITEIPGLGHRIYCMANDRAGGLWIGTKENGIRYINNKGKLLINSSAEPYPYPKSGYYSSDRAERLAGEYARGIVNCSAEDSDGYVFLGTRKGLVIIDRNDRIIATLNKNAGLPGNNVQSILAGIPANGKPGGKDIWFSTATGFSRLRIMPKDTFEFINLGILDGIYLDGSELPSQSMACDSTGLIVAAYSGGTLRFNPLDLDDKGYVIHRFPEKRSPENTDDTGGGDIVMKIIFYAVSLSVIAALVLLIIRSIKRKRKKELTQTPSDNGNRESGDNAKAGICDDFVSRYKENAGNTDKSVSNEDAVFAEKVRKIVSERLGDESFNVVTLSGLMAMDRTNLYRRMQSAMGVSPSAYIKEMRLTAAAGLLRETDIPVAEIALATGFSSTKYFSSAFKEFTGFLPSQYRTMKKHNSGEEPKEEEV